MAPPEPRQARVLRIEDAGARRRTGNVYHADKSATRLHDENIARLLKEMFAARTPEEQKKIGEAFL